MAAVLILLVAGCTGSRSVTESAPDEQFGHRFEGEAPDGRRTIAIGPAQEGAQYSFFPATFESVVVRPAPFEAERAGEDVEVEALIKGAFPDACMQLHSFAQERTGHIITASLQMRRSQGSVCAGVERPYRFYVLLDGLYTAGHYTLKLNGQAIAFQVRAPSS